MQHLRVAYSPALRMKAGELEGVQALSGDTADLVLPRFIIPPAKERVPRQYSLLETAAQPDFGGTLATYWPLRPVLMDATYVIDEYGRETLADWLPSMFSRARARCVDAIPAALLSDLGEAEAPAFRGAIGEARPLRFAIVAPFTNILEPGFEAEIMGAVHRLRLKPVECAIIADFSAADFSDPQLVAPVITAALERLQEIGRWHLVIFQGTHFPEKNPAADGAQELWPRNEWKAWCLAVQFNPSTADHMIFGDFAADCAKIAFNGSGGMAICHLRYATKEYWVVQRATRSGKIRERMRAVCKSIVEGGRFAGSKFSTADATIAQIAQGAAGPGNAKTWRQLNTTHHISQVISDIENVKGAAVKEVAHDSVEAREK